ncbi:hypothetical protein [Secundilactobacillus odoratitofui]|uniref:hypothetical protein n=1 Tax=Secundilactobacillus odoratitofui TaxID=480930 RepID=UPI0034E233B4
MDGNRRFTALRIFQQEDNVPKDMDAIIIPLDSKNDQKNNKGIRIGLTVRKRRKSSI